MSEQPDFIAAALERIRRADTAMDDGAWGTAKHERSVAHIYAVLATRQPLESLEQIEGSEETPHDPPP